MPKTFPPKTRRAGETYRLRRDVFDSLAKQRGATTVDLQVKLTGVSRATLYRVFSGEQPRLDIAMKLSDALGAHPAALFERVKDAA